MFSKSKKIHLLPKATFLTLFFFALFMSNAVQALAAPFSPQEIGLWATKQNDGVFQIYRCNAMEEKLCGRFVGMQYKTPLPPTSKQGNSQCHFVMLRHFVQEKSGKKWSGTIYDPRDEKGYDAKIWLTAKGELKVRGYLGISLFGETHTWHRFSGHILQNCRLPDVQ